MLRDLLPAFSANITGLVHSTESLASKCGYMFAFVNEFDLLPRTDQVYLRSLVDLYRASYDLQPLTVDSISRKGSEAGDQSLDGKSTYTLLPLELCDIIGHPE